MGWSMTRQLAECGEDRRPIGNAAEGKVLNDDRADWREAWALFPGDVAYVWHAGMFGTRRCGEPGVCGFQIRSQIIWAKTRLRSAAATTTGSTSRAGMR
jgi:hypothetical protein